MAPLLDEVKRLRGDIVATKEKLKAIKKADKQSDKVEALEIAIHDQERARRSAENKAEGIGKAVFDLKAINPNIVVKIDDRTPSEVINSIQEQGKIMNDSFSRLRGLLKV